VVVVEVNGYTVEPRANLNGVDLEGANLREPKANEDTIWPEGFDPIAAGVIFD
tara:strand:- start:85 stop:243 length:159 start_codon:yes stop_codon:yes gene_type:complete